MTTKSIKSISVGVVTLVLAVYLSLFLVERTRANPSFFNSSQTAAATTTLTYMTAGTATTTLSLDSMVGINQALDSAVLDFCFNASSTSSTLNANIEYSHDNSTWFQSNLSERATTTQDLSLQIRQSFSYQYASTTVGGAAVPSNINYGCKAVTVNTPTRYVRAVFSLPVGSTNGAIWAQFLAKRQTVN